MLLPGAFGPAGGLEMYGRLLLMATARFCRDRGGALEVLILNDRQEDLSPRYYGGTEAKVRGFARRKGDFVARAMARMVALAPDLVIVGHVNMSPLALALWALRPSAAQWFVVYGIDAWHHLRPPARIALRRCSRILSISGFTRRELCRCNGIQLEKVDLLPCALDPFHQELADRRTSTTTQGISDPPTVLTVSRLRRGDSSKGIDFALEAFAEVLKRIPEARHEIIGDGDDRSRLEELAARLGIRDRVTFRGRVDDEELASAYARSTVFVMPSRTEGFGIVFLEAALHGKPSIGGAHGGSLEVIEDGVAGFLVSHGDVPALADRITSLLSDRSLARKLGAAARARVDRDFTYPALEKRLQYYLSRDLGERP